MKRASSLRPETARSGRARRLFALLARAVVVQALFVGAAAAEPDKRDVPDYDGRPEPTTPGDVLLWVPRIVLSPLYLVSEFVVRRPLGFLITEAERAHAPEFLYSLFMVGAGPKAGIFPIAFVDFGFDPSVGAYFFWDDALVEGHDVRLRASTWGSDWLAARLTDRWDLGHERELSFDASAVRRPDLVFYGLGPRTLESDLTRYGADRFDAHSEVAFGLWRASRFSAALGVRSLSFHRGGYDRDPTLEEQVAAGALPEPDGYARGYTALYDRLRFVLDSRRPRPAPGSGVRVEVGAEQESDLRGAAGTGFVRYDAAAGGFLDLNQQGRVLSLSITTSFADPLGPRPIPFTELATVGGAQSMRGFFPGRLYDRSAAIATLHYHWPIWIVLDGSIQLAVGNVFGPHLEGLSPELLRFSGAIGVESVGSPDSAFELLLGIGSETFEQGGDITSVRVAVGTNHGF